MARPDGILCIFVKFIPLHTSMAVSRIVVPTLWWSEYPVICSMSAIVTSWRKIVSKSCLDKIRKHPHSCWCSHPVDVNCCYFDDMHLWNDDILLCVGLLWFSTFAEDSPWQGTTPFRLVLTNFLHLQFLFSFRTMAYFLLRVFSREGWKALVIFSVWRNLVAFLAWGFSNGGHDIVGPGGHFLYLFVVATGDLWEAFLPSSVPAIFTLHPFVNSGVIHLQACQLERG